MSNPGIIYFIGTGPGDPDLITVKGLTRLREADAVVGDLFTLGHLAREARPEAERFDTGSQRRGNRVPQAQVIERLVELAQSGKTVARLFEGDPFMFGRAAEEMAEVKKAGERVAVVPGVSSVIAAPIFAGVPLTHWQINAGFAVVSGFVPETVPTLPNWAALAGVDTLVILMPLENLADIVGQLLAAGRSANTPVMIIQNGTLPSQKQVAGTLGTLAETVTRHNIQSPALVVVGEVVRLADELAWFDRGEGYPLAGQRVLVTRPAHQAAEFTLALRHLGAVPISFPTVEIVPLADTGPLDQAIKQIGRPTGGETSFYYDWLVLTSANGVTAFWERLQAAGLDSRYLAAVRIAAIGPATATALWQRSITPDLVPTVYTAEGVLEAFDRSGSIAGQRFLLARADIARQALSEGLRERGAIVDEFPSYHTVPVSGGPLPPAAEIVTFTSSSTVQGYVNCLGGRSPTEVLRHSRVVCIGPITAATAKNLGVPVSAVAETYTIEGLLDVLKQIEVPLSL